MNSQEAALSLGIAVRTPRRWGKAGKLRTVQTAGHLAHQLERLLVAATECGYQVRVEVLDPPERIAPTPELLADILTIVTVLSGKLYAYRAHANPRRKASVIGSRVQQKSRKKKGRPGLPGAADHPTFYQGAFELDLEEATIRDRLVRLKVYDGQQWAWMNYRSNAHATSSAACERRTGSG